MLTTTRLAAVAVVLAGLVAATAPVGASPSVRVQVAPADSGDNSAPVDGGTGTGTGTGSGSGTAPDVDVTTPPRPHSPENPDSAPTPQPSGTPTPAPVPAPPLDLGAINVLTQARQAAITQAEARHAAQVAAAVAAAKTAAVEAETAARTRLEESTKAVDKAKSVLEARQRRLDTARTEHLDAKKRNKKAQERIRSVAVGGFASTTDPLDPIAEAVFGDRDLADATSTAVYATAAARGATDESHRASNAERDAKRAVSRATDAVEDAREPLSEAQADLTRSQSALDVTLIANEAMVATAANVPLPPELLMAGSGGAIGAFGPQILGPSLVPAEDLAAFVRARGRAHPSIDLDELAEAFIWEGALEGVAADIAWVQSIIETGWFGYRGSMVFATDHNYAGIGACDSCGRGFVFGSPQLGARAQMQLLRIYATPGLKTSDLANPPVRTVPERLHVRGCCGTWMELSGVWATGPGYGIKILSLYNELLSFSAARRGL